MLLLILVGAMAAVWFGTHPFSPKIVELSFDAEDARRNPDEQTLNSIQRFGDLYVVTYHGDYEERLRLLNNWHVQESAKVKHPISCSLFAARTAHNEPLFGRNFDREQELPVLIRFEAPGKYRSFAFSPASECSVREVQQHLSEDTRNKFLYSIPFYVTDGINEKGLAIGIAGAPIRRVQSSKTQRPAFVLLLIRRALDSCQNIDEVAKLAQTIAPYDKSLNTISHHFLAVDADGNWLVIDYPDGKLRLTRGTGNQVRTNDFIDGNKAEEGVVDKTSPRRFRKLSQTLGKNEPLASDAEAMDLLRGVSNSTVWSVIYNTRKKEGIVAARENYRTQYRFRFSQ